MSNVINVVTKLFNRIFTISYGGFTLFDRVIQMIRRVPLFYLGVVLLVIGFCVSIIKRIIHS